MAEVGRGGEPYSNQIQRIVDRGILGSHRDGNNIHYRIVDLCRPAEGAGRCDPGGRSPLERPRQRSWRRAVPPSPWEAVRRWRRSPWY